MRKPFLLSCSVLLLAICVSNCGWPFKKDNKTQKPPAATPGDSLSTTEDRGLTEDTSGTADIKEGMHYGALETYHYWAGEDPGDNNVKALNGQYWSSAHFTKEYMLYMELIVSNYLASHFPEDNGLTRSKEYIDPPGDAPDWFKPPKKFEVWTGQQGSIYYFDMKTGHMFMYEVQM